MRDVLARAVWARDEDAQLATRHEEERIPRIPLPHDQFTIAQTQEELKRLESELETAYHRWEELESIKNNL